MLASGKNLLINLSQDDVNLKNRSGSSIIKDRSTFIEKLTYYRSISSVIHMNDCTSKKGLLTWAAAAWSGYFALVSLVS